MESETIFRVAIIGGGAAGFFAAISLKENYPKSQVVIFEKSHRVLSKVTLSGGGRCNLTNGCTDNQELATAYPRGGRQMKNLFREFSTENTIEWFESRGVPLVIQEDNCVFPRSQDSRSVTDLLQNECKKLGVSVKTGYDVKEIYRGHNDTIGLRFQNSELETTQEEITELFNKVIVTTGGSPKEKGLEWLKKLGHKIENPVPSLFTFNIPTNPVRELMGVVIDNAIIGLQGTNLKSQGALLITHWGMSGPAVLKLSSYAARVLSEQNYDFTIQVNWTGQQNNQIVLETIIAIAKDNPAKQVHSVRPYNITQRLWDFLLTKQGIILNQEGEIIEKKWAEVGKKGLNKIAEILTNDQYNVKGKASFKEEFVTCGGVSLKSVNMSTMQSKVFPGLYFAGEILDIDAITGGYNLQAAWTTAFVAAKLT